jgi:MoaA/NifB/PqqE/SkfB family radical SAM enzyme
VPEVPYMPVKRDVENVSRCNFKCTMCAVSGWKKGRRADDMSLASFKQLIDEQYGLVEIKLNGLGEALMQGDDYFAMIRYARAQRIWVRITTNASLLHLNDNHKKLVDSGVNEIDISIDGADDKTFQKIRVGSKFSQVRKNCQLLNSYAAQQERHFTKMWTLVQQDNEENLELHVPLAAELGFKHLVFSTQLHGWGDLKFAKENAAKEFILTQDRASHLIQLGKQHGVRVAFWDVSAKFDMANRCPWPFERAVVTSDLRTVPCCMIGNPDQFEIGKGRSFLVNWKSKEYKEFRQAHLSGDIPTVCKGCYK